MRREKKRKTKREKELDKTMLELAFLNALQRRKKEE
jgi:hypothetical protein